MNMDWEFYDQWYELTWSMVCHRSMATLNLPDWGLEMLIRDWDEYLITLL